MLKRNTKRWYASKHTKHHIIKPRSIFCWIVFQAVYFGCVRIAYTQWLNRKLRVLASLWSRIHIFHFNMNAWIWIKCSIYSWVRIFFSCYITFPNRKLTRSDGKWARNPTKVMPRYIYDYLVNGSIFDSKRNSTPTISVAHRNISSLHM